jgi:hypothetical protein
MKRIMFLVGIILAIIITSCHKPQISCEIVKPAPGTVFELGENVDLALSVEVQNTSVDEVQIYLDGVGYDKKSFFPFNFLIRSRDLEKGAHTIRVVAIANSGAKDEKTVTFNVNKYEIPDFVSFSDGKFPKGCNYENWMIVSPGYDDNYCIRTYAYSYNAVSVYKDCGANIKFIEFYAKEDEPYWYPAELLFFLDGQCIERITMDTSWKKYTFPVSLGEHTFSWRATNEYVYLDAIRFYNGDEE